MFLVIKYMILYPRLVPRWMSEAILRSTFDFLPLFDFERWYHAEACFGKFRVVPCTEKTKILVGQNTGILDVILPKGLQPGPAKY